MNRRSVRWLWVLLPAVVLVVMFGSVNPAAAQTPGPAESVQVDAPAGVAVAIPPVDGPTTVGIDVYVHEILGIDERENTFQVLASLEAKWNDKRSVPVNCDDSNPTVYDGEGATERLKADIWSPGFYVVRARTPRETSAVAVTVYCDGTVVYKEQFAATVFQQFAGLNNFPYDEHEMSFSIAPFADAERSVIVFEPLYNLGAGGAFEADSWDSEEWDFSVSFADQRLDPETPEITTVIQIDRKWRYYWWNIIAPLLLFVFIAWSVFWLGDNLGERLAMSITILLTVVAFDFVTSDDLPRLSYTTRLDAFYNVSYVAIALTVVLSIIATRRYGSASEETAAKVINAAEGEYDTLVGADGGATENGDNRIPMVDVVSRFAFPYLYSLAVLMALTGMFSPGASDTAEADSGEITGAIDPIDSAEVLDQVDELSLDLAVSGKIPGSAEPDFYRLCATADTSELSVKMKRIGDQTDVLDPFLVVYEEDGSFITADDNSAGGLDSLVTFDAEPDNCYLVEAGALLEEEGGDYELEATAGVFEEDLSDFDLDPIDSAELLDQADELSLDAPVSGTIDEGDAVDPYRFCAPEDGGGEILSLTMKRTGDETDVLDPFLVVYEEDGSFITQDDDSAGQLDSLVIVEVEPGNCSLIVASGFEQSTGDYEITATFGEIEVSELEAD